MNKPEPKYLNSAGRLLAVLEALPDNQTFSQQLIPLFLGKEHPKDSKSVSIDGLRVVIELQTIYVSFLQELKDADIPDEEKTVLEKGLSTLDTLMYPVAVNQTQRLVSEAEKAILEVCATRLPKENAISEDDIENIHSSIKSLKEAINDLPTDSILRNVLLELVRLSEDSINRYNIYGAKGLKHAFKSMLSEVSEIYLQDEEDATAIKKSKAWSKAVKHLKLFDSIAAKAMKYRPLLEKASQYLLGG